MPDTVSVLIPAFGAETFIADAVNSVLAQSWQEFEIIIAADDAEDYIAILAAQHIRDARIRCVQTGGVATGPSHARNVALAAANGPLIATLDADDVLHENAFSLLVPNVLQHGAAYSDIEFMDFASAVILPNYNQSLSAGVLGLTQALARSVHNYVWIVFDRRRLPDARWDERVRYFDDLLFFARCCDQLGQLYYTPERLYTYRRREASLCNQPRAAQKFMEAADAIIRDLENTADYTPAAREILTRYMQRWREFETLFEAKMRSGTYSDYQDFLRDHREWLYRL